MKLLRLILSWIYGFVVAIRNMLYEYGFCKSWSPPVSTVCVGNLAVGGTGKTPHSILLIEQMKDEFKVAFLSRGYKRKTSGFLLADENATALTIGDEPMQVHMRFPDIPVAVCEKRVNGVKQLLKRFPDLDCIILDDALQHRQIKPGYVVLLTAYDNLYVKDHMLPYGHLRDSRHSSPRAETIVVTKCPENMTPIDRRMVCLDLAVLPYQHLFFTQMHYGEIRPVFDAKTDVQLSECSVCLFTGIASPKYVQEYLEQKVNLLKTIAFPDHHSFTKKNFQRIEKEFGAMPSENKILLTTEKDAMRLRSSQHFPEHLKSLVYYLPIEIQVMDNHLDKFIQNIKAYVRENKRNS